jgi:hypothetical protein
VRCLAGVPDCCHAPVAPLARRGVPAASPPALTTRRAALPWLARLARVTGAAAVGVAGGSFRSSLSFGCGWRLHLARFEADHDLALDTPCKQLLDVGEQRALLGRDQRNGDAGTARAAGPADPMNIVRGHVRQLEVDDVRQFFDVQATRGNVRRHQDTHRSRLEASQRTRARRLALVAVNRRRLDAGLAQVFRQAVRAALHARENQHLPPVA